MSDFTKKFLTAVAIVVGLLFLWTIRDILGILFGAIIISSATAPLVDRLQKIGLPRVFGGLMVYIGVIVLIAGVLTIVLPPLASELAQLAQSLPGFLQDASFFGGEQSLSEIIAGSQQALQQLSQQLNQIGQGVFQAATQLVGSFVSLVIILVISFYLSVQDQGIKRFLQATIPKQYQKRVLKIVDRSQRTLAHWLQAELVTGAAVGVLVFTGLSILGVKFALVLSIIAFLFEFIPFLGPILAAIPAIILAFTQDVSLGLLTVLLYVIVQQIENHILVPQMMHRFMHINPIFVILALLIGAKLGGVGGALLSVPILALVMRFLEEFYGFKFTVDLPPPPVEPTKS